MSENITHDEFYDNENDDAIIEVIENKYVSLFLTSISPFQEIQNVVM